jgi:hypothetical protein
LAINFSKTASTDSIRLKLSGILQFIVIKENFKALASLLIALLPIHVPFNRISYARPSLSIHSGEFGFVLFSISVALKIVAFPFEAKKKLITRILLLGTEL